MRYYKGQIFLCQHLTLFSSVNQKHLVCNYFSPNHISNGIPGAQVSDHCCPCFIPRSLGGGGGGRATDASQEKRQLFRWKKKKQGLDDMLHAVILI